MFHDFFEKVIKHSPISVGMRTFKTWLAVTVTATLALTDIIGNPFYAVMGTVFGMQNTLSMSFEIARSRITGTAVGAFIGFMFSYLGLTSPPQMALAIVLVIFICRILKIEEAIFITFTLCLLILITPDREEGLFVYTTLRVVDTAIGLMVGLFINYFIAPPNYLKNLTLELESLYTLTEKAATDFAHLPKLKKKLVILDYLHTNYLADYKYDNHFVSLSKIEKAVEACNYLYFHLKHMEPHEEFAKDHQKILVQDTLDLVGKTIDELKGVI